MFVDRRADDTWGHVISLDEMNGVLAVTRHGTYDFLACAALILLATFPSKELMNCTQLNLKSLRS